MSRLASRFDICMIVDNDVTHDARVQKEAASLAAHGWKVVVVGISRSGAEPPPEEKTNGFMISRVVPRMLRHTLANKPGQILRTVEGFVRAAICLRRFDAHIYHAHDFTGLVIVALAGIWVRPVIYDSHELYFGRPLAPLTRHLSFVLQPIERWLARRSTRVIATTQARADEFVRSLQIDEPVIVRNAVDLRQPQAAAVAIQAHDRIKIIHSGWLIAGRHLRELVATLQFLPPNISVVLIGSGPLQESLETLAKQLNASDRLEIVGAILPEQMIRTLKQATLAAVLITDDYLSYYLSLPNKFFEAVAAGLPIIASPIPEVKHMIESYDIGVLCNPKDPQEIALAIQTALKPENFSRLQANVKRAQQDLNWEAEERKLIALYESVFAESGAGR